MGKCPFEDNEILGLLTGAGHSQEEAEAILLRWKEKQEEWYAILALAKAGDYIDASGSGMIGVGKFYYNKSGVLVFEGYLNPITESGVGWAFDFSVNPWNPVELLEWARQNGAPTSDLAAFFEWGPESSDHQEDIILGRPETNTGLPNGQHDRLVYWAGTGLYGDLRYAWDLNTVRDATKDAMKGLEGKNNGPNPSNVLTVAWYGMKTIYTASRRLVTSKLKGYNLYE